MKSFSAVVLAGGRSFRMGTDKAFLDWRGKPLWQHQRDTLLTAGADEVFVSGHGGQEFPDAVVIRDELTEGGPLAGIARALREARHSWVVVLAVDLPLMTSEFISRRLLDRVSRDEGVVPCLDERFEPLAAVYPRGLAELAESRLGSSDRSLQGFCLEAESRGAVSRCLVEEAERALFRNINTPDDFKR